MPKFPETGRPREEVLATLEALKANDADWQHGRVPLYVFKATEGVAELGRDAFMSYFTENALGGRRAFHSVKRMEDEVVAMALDLFHGPAGATGNMTTGGTESIVMAIKTCRDWTRAKRGQARLRGNIVMPFSAHPAFEKGGHLMDIEVRRVPVREDLRADARAMAGAIDAETIMLVGSVPCFPYGVVDPIPELGELAASRGLWLHVDACVGGYFAPFARELGAPIPDFDFAVPGVSSISADLHKFGFTPKPASTVFYRDAEKAAAQTLAFDTWPSGRFATETLVGTRPAGAVAASWAVFNFLGRAGYREVARQLLEMRQAYERGVAAIPGLHVWGKPDLSILSFGATHADIFRVADRMATRNWIPGLIRKPPGMHAMMSLYHAPSREQFLADLRTSLAEVEASAPAKAKSEAVY